MGWLMDAGNCDELELGVVVYDGAEMDDRE